MARPSKTRAPKSPWQKYNKAAFVYSATYQEWKAEAIKNGAGTDKALAMACHHAKMVRVRHNAPDGKRLNDCEGKSL
jgi:hypothetical protein